MLTRSLVYTAITRAKSKVILVGQIGMLYMAVHKDDTGKRNTQLGHRISLYCNISVAACHPLEFSGTNFSNSARLSFDEYPHSIELRASIAIWRLRK